MRQELAIFAGLATAIVFGIAILVVLPGRDATVATTVTSAARIAKTSPQPPQVAAPRPSITETASAVPSVEEPRILGIGTDPMSSAKVPKHAMGEADDELLLEQKDVTSTIAKYRDRLQPCASKTPSSVTVLVKVQPDGWIESLRVQSFSGDEAQATCVKSVVGKWHFPSTTSGATVSLPFALEKE